MPTIEDLRYFQSLPLDIKVAMTQTRLREWVNHYGVSGVYVSFSGGKDSTVLLHIARSLYPDIPACFVDTGLEYPEIKAFVKTFDNVEIVRPKKTFKQVICEYGYPMLSKEISERVFNSKKCIENNYEKYVEHYYQLTGDLPTINSREKYGERFLHRYSFKKYKPLLYVDFNLSSKCCDVMKKKPLKTKTKNNITAQMAEESQLRTQKWLQNGCNAFDNKRPISNPMSFWTEQDVLQYIRDNHIPIASVYGDIVYEDTDGQTRFEGCGKLCTTGCTRTGW